MTKYILVYPDKYEYLYNYSFREIVCYEIYNEYEMFTHNNILYGYNTLDIICSYLNKTSIYVKLTCCGIKFYKYLNNRFIQLKDV